LVARRTLIKDFRAKLEALLAHLESDNLFSRPLVVIIDELDRCRPTYALRVLEEAKHFFDDTGTVFLYGMNREALSATVRAVYGSGFPAEHYLLRFIRRQVALPSSTLSDFVEGEFKRNSGLVAKLRFPDADGNSRPDLAYEWIAKLFDQNEILARDAEYVLELIFSFAAMWNHKTFIHLPYLAILAAAAYRKMRGDGQGQLRILVPSVVQYERTANETGSDLNRMMGIFDGCNFNQSEVSGIVGRWIEMEICEEVKQTGGEQTSGWHRTYRTHIGEYRKLLSAVGKIVVPPPTQSPE
jgi:hypothetical protein